MGIETGTLRTVIELVTDEGVVGLGETHGGAATVNAVDEARPIFIGMDPFEVQTIVKRFELFRIPSEQMARMAELKNVGAAVELACLDLIGKALDKSVSDLWGGADVEAVEFIAHVLYRYASGGVGGEATTQDIVARYG